MLLSLSLPLAVAGCREEGAAKPEGQGDQAVVYVSVDEGFARQILDRYQERSGARLSLVFDSEAGKTTGLVRKIENEAGRPRADVFWSGELFNTILLARKGLLEPYESPAAADIPQRYKDREHRWTALAVRARVIAFDPAKTPADQVPTAWEALAQPEVASRLAFANPLFGTTRGHVAAMFALWGPERGRTFLTSLHENDALVVDGNSTAVRTVMAGRASFCATDTDDVWVAQRAGASLELVYPDMGDGGTLLVPCSVAMMKGAPHPEAARKLIDYLVSAEVERALAESDSRNVPVRERLRESLGMSLPPETKVSFDAIADAMEESVAAVREILIR